MSIETAEDARNLRNKLSDPELSALVRKVLDRIEECAPEHDYLRYDGAPPEVIANLSARGFRIVQAGQIVTISW